MEPVSIILEVIVLMQAIKEGFEAAKDSNKTFITGIRSMEKTLADLADPGIQLTPKDQETLASWKVDGEDLLKELNAQTGSFGHRLWRSPMKAQRLIARLMHYDAKLDNLYTRTVLRTRQPKRHPPVRWELGLDDLPMSLRQRNHEIE